MGCFIFAAACSNSSRALEDELPEATGGIAFVSDRSGNWDIYLVKPTGGSVAQLTDHPTVDSDPDWSADGRQIAFRSRRDGSSDIFVMGADGSDPVNLIRDPADSLDDEFAPRWHPDGFTFSLYTDRYPPRGSCKSGFHQIALLRTEEDDQSIDLFETIPGEQTSSSWSPDGRNLVFSSMCLNSNVDLYLYDAQSGDTRILVNEPFSEKDPAWSHNGQFLAYAANMDGNFDIYLLDLETKRSTRLTNHPAKDTQPAWSPDDSQIAFVTNRDGNQEVYIMEVDGSNTYNLTQHPADDWYPAWSPVE